MLIYAQAGADQEPWALARDGSIRSRAICARYPHPRHRPQLRRRPKPKQRREIWLGWRKKKTKIRSLSLTPQSPRRRLPPNRVSRFVASFSSCYVVVFFWMCVQEGYLVEHEGKCITVFSAPNYCDQVRSRGGMPECLVCMSTSTGVLR